MADSRRDAPRSSTASSWGAAAALVAGLLFVPLAAWIGLAWLAPRAPAPAAADAPEPAAQASVERVAPAPREARVVAGAVLDEAGASVEGALVEIDGRRDLRATSGPDGRFRFSDAPLEALELVASRSGFAAARARVAAGAAGSEAQIELRLAPERPVGGLVLGGDGKPVAGAFVSCEDRDDAPAARTDVEGRFRLAASAAGCLAIATHPEHGPSAPARLDASRDNELELGRPGGMNGHVVDEQGAPVASFQLGVESFVPAGSDERPAPNGKTKKFDDPDGAFLLPALPPGRYVLTASADGRPPARSAAVDVEAGRTRHDVRIVLARGGTMTGTVIDGETRAPLAGAALHLDAATWTTARLPAATTDASGAYVLDGVPAGPFSVRVERDGYVTRILSGLTTRSGPLRRDVELAKLGDGGSATELAGIGAVLAAASGPGGVTIAAVTSGGPAALAGLARGDRLVRIDGAATDDMTVPDCVQLLRGPEGSSVTVVIGRAGQPDREVTLVRALIRR
jgi:hypothetical protein